MRRVLMLLENADFPNAKLLHFFREPFVALTYGLWGRSSVDAEMVAGTGEVTLGVQATYRSVWHVEVRITDYIGSAGRQPL